MAAKILPHKSTQTHKRNANHQPERKPRKPEFWYQENLGSWLGHVKEELGDVESTLRGLARTSILLEKLSGEELYSAVNAHSSLIGETATWLDRLRDDLGGIIGEHGNRPEKKGGAR